ncbi:putative transcriptional regulator, CopG/Arc/MetJ family [Pyrobaculum islandicum DSM 4184]|uniref:Transcriptional regulator, CopG/Arc/MetJ family n=1 Tax=Pyrobaculum islandicum (strain DSM 4184 / JCM 9189 / GEO3) TaxID=384616 RepID=A1RT43_PYRIL|nr:ribbon-helix-helix domain-containing protein [Pyrobaculum islandicum]ABL88125.1 putative transcriptional regulator, CopG/Arc/MetJ family [Pyrobaculum islandicum DSM 4184]
MEYEKSVVTTVILPKHLVRKIDRLVTRGYFRSRGDVIKYAIENLLKKYAV